MNNDLNDDQKKLASELANLILQRVYIRFAPQFDEADIDKLEELDKNDPTGESVKEFLTSKFPDFENIFQEETEKLKNQIMHSTNSSTSK